MLGAPFAEFYPFIHPSAAVTSVKPCYTRTFLFAVPDQVLMPLFIFIFILKKELGEVIGFTAAVKAHVCQGLKVTSQRIRSSDCKLKHKKFHLVFTVKGEQSAWGGCGISTCGDIRTGHGPGQPA